MFIALYLSSNYLTIDKVATKGTKICFKGDLQRKKCTFLIISPDHQMGEKL